MRRWRAVLPAGLCSVALLISACSDSPSREREPTGVAIKASDTSCLVATTSFQSGSQTFEVSNAGSQVTEVILYGAGDRVVGEVSNIGPSTGKRLTVSLKPGRYSINCKPGLVGKGMSTSIVVKAASGGAAPTISPQLDAAVASYRRYVVAQAVDLLAKTKPFVAAVEAGDVAKARSLYPAARAPYESIEPIADSSGDLEPRIDARIDDVENGQEWIGFHRLEHDLWISPAPPSSPESTAPAPTQGPIAAPGEVDISQDGPVAAALLADVTSLVGQVQRVELTADQISAAAVTLLDTIAGRGLAGEQERYSGVDLVDVAANVAGANQAYLALRPILLTEDADLVAKIDLRFLTAEQALSDYGSGSSFAVYSALSKADLRPLSAAVNDLIGPMGSVTSTLRKGD